MPLTKGRNVHLAMVGYGPLCDAKVQTRSPEGVALRLMETTPECGQKGQVIRISQQEAVEITPERHFTKRRVLAKILSSIGSIAVLSIVPLTSSDPESWLLLGNFVIPAGVAYLAWEAIPQRLDYVIRVTCLDPLHCFGDSKH